MTATANVGDHPRSPAKYGTPVSPVSSRRLRQIFLSRRQKCDRQHDGPSHDDQRSHGARGDFEFLPDRASDAPPPRLAASSIQHLLGASASAINLPPTKIDSDRRRSNVRRDRRLDRIREVIPLKRQSFPAPDDPAHGRLVALPTNQLAPPPIPWGGFLHSLAFTCIHLTFWLGRRPPALVSGSAGLSSTNLCST
jgi:hypothetical protein